MSEPKIPQQEIALNGLWGLTLKERLYNPLYRKWVRFLIFGRAVPAVFFLGIAVLVLENRILRPLSGGGGINTLLAGVAPSAVYLLFCLLPVGIYLTRPMPKAQDGSLLARCVAFLGAFLQLGVALIPAGPLLWAQSVPLSYIVSVLEFIAFSFACYAMFYLRHNLSIIPQARELVTTGPYSFVRNPLYLAEISAAILNVLNASYLVPVIILVMFIALQVWRADFEARLLNAVFPSYKEYGNRTARLIPGVW